MAQKKKKVVVEEKSNLRDSNETLYAVQHVGHATEKWIDMFWMLFTLTLTPWKDHKDRDSSSDVRFKNKEVAISVVKAIREKYPQERLRIVKRQVIIKEALVKE